MPLLNYTTSISADKTIGEIQKCLASHGAIAIMNEYDDTGYIIGLSFIIKVDEQKISFRLPCDWRPVLQILDGDLNVPNRLVTEEQAIKVSWRIIKDWVEAQMAIVETKMVKTEQVFLPYAVERNGKTVYDNMIESKVLLNSGDNN
jgi:hypothetical protein